MNRLVVLLCVASLAFAGFPLVQAQNGSVLALGLTNTPIGEASLSVVDDGVLRLDQLNNGGNGVSVQLGQAPGGAFFYIYPADLYPDYFMIGHAYGRVDGEQERLIGWIKGVKGVGLCPFEADFRAIGCTNLTVQVFSNQRLVGERAFEGGFIPPNTAWVEDADYGQYNTRANPFWRTPEGEVGAMIELPYETTIVLNSGVYPRGNRIFIRADHPSNRVEFVSRIESRSGGTSNSFLYSYCFTDGRVGIFNRPHKALGRTMLGVTVSNLTLRLDENPNVTNSLNGVHVELGGAESFLSEIKPVELSQVGDRMKLASIARFLGASGNFPGTVELLHAADSHRLNIAFRTNITDSVRIEVYQDTTFVSAVQLAGVSHSIEVSGEPRVIALGARANGETSAAGYLIHLDRTVSLSSPQFPTSPPPAGNRIYVLTGTPAPISELRGLSIMAAGISNFTLVAESAAFRPLPPLQIAPGEGSSLELRWPDRNAAWVVESSDSLTRPFRSISAPTQAGAENQKLMFLPSTNSAAFFRLGPLPVLWNE